MNYYEADNYELNCKYCLFAEKRIYINILICHPNKMYLFTILFAKYRYDMVLSNV